MSRALDTLASGARSILGQPLTGGQAESFHKYLNLLQKWQKVQRLIGSVDSDWIVENLFLDSLLFLRVLPREILSIADLGSGAGLPGIPIKIARPEVAVTLIESRERRVSFLSAALRELGLHGIRVLSGRAEEIAASTPQAFGAVVMRCAGHPAEVVPVAIQLVAPGGVIVVAGPPRRDARTAGQWVEVPGVQPGTTRGFVVHRRVV